METRTKNGDPVLNRMIEYEDRAWTTGHNEETLYGLTMVYDKIELTYLKIDEALRHTVNH